MSNKLSVKAKAKMLAEMLLDYHASRLSDPDVTPNEIANVNKFLKDQGVYLELEDDLVEDKVITKLRERRETNSTSRLSKKNISRADTDKADDFINRVKVASVE